MKKTSQECETALSSQLDSRGVNGSCVHHGVGQAAGRGVVHEVHHRMVHVHGHGVCKSQSSHCDQLSQLSSKSKVALVPGGYKPVAGGYKHVGDL